MFLELLESRLLLSVDPLASAAMAASLDQATVLSTIVWTNRGTAGDNFDAAFGAGAPADAARAVVDAAIDAWNRVVVNFHHAAGIGPPDLSETISMDLGTNGFGAGTSTTIGADGKPTAGSVTINLGDSTGDGISDWWVDPTPNDNSEFMGTPLNAFTGTAQAGSPANGRFDLFSVVLAELTHNMGIANAGAATALYNTGGFTTDTGIADDAEGGGVGNFWLFQGPSVAALMTNNNGGAGGSAVTFPLHTAGPRAGNAPINFGGRTVFGVDDNGNAVGGASQRTLVSNKTALIVHDAFAYDIVMPETFGTFYAILNETTGLLTVRGGADNTVINTVNQGASSDNITLTRSGDSIVVSIDVGVDVPGTGTGFAVNDQQDAFVSIFDAGKVTSINVLAGDGNDTVTIGAAIGASLTADGQSGNDALITESAAVLIGGPGDDYLYGSTGNDTLTGDAGNDTIYAGTGNNTVSDGTDNDLVDLSENSVAIAYTTGGGNDTVIGTAFNDTITGSSGADRLEGRGGNDSLIGAGGADTLIGGDESDTFTWNPGDGSDVIEGGDGGNDVMVFNGSGVAEVFTLSAVGTRLQLLRNVGVITMDVAGVEQVNLNALAGADLATVNDLTGTDVQVVNIDLGVGGDADSATVNGRAVADNLTAAVSGSVVTVTGLNYNVNVSSATTVDTLTVNGNDGDDTIKAVSPIESTIGIVLNGGNGNDFLSADATLNGGDGNDTLVGGAGNDSMTGGDGDDVFLLTANNGGGTDTVDGGNGGDTILIQGGSANDLITLSIATGNLAATIGGVTTIYNLAGSNFEQVVADGGGQISPEGDRVDLIATGGADAIAITGPAVSLGGVTVVSIGVEDFRLDAGGGTDTLTYTGIVGVTESISVAGSPTPNSGKFSVPGVLKLSFTNAELIDVIGNAADNDTLTFSGTNDPDLFQINLAAAGTTADPILKLQTGALAPLLTLRNYTGFQTLNVNGLNGSDTFNVLTSATGPNRNLFVDGDLPAGKKKSTDQLNIFYTPPRPHIIQSGATQDPDAGLVDLDYGTAQYLVQYDGMEEVVIRRL